MTLTYEILKDKILGCWNGKNAGGVLGAPYEDSCLEFFFAPMDGDIRYFNIEFNSNRCLYLGFGRCMEDHTRFVHDEGVEILSPKASLTETGWEIFYTVPDKFIRRFFPDFEIK